MARCSPVSATAALVAAGFGKSSPDFGQTRPKAGSHWPKLPHITQPALGLHSKSALGSKIRSDCAEISERMSTGQCVGELFPSNVRVGRRLLLSSPQQYLSSTRTASAHQKVCRPGVPEIGHARVASLFRRHDAGLRGHGAGVKTGRDCVTP